MALFRKFFYRKPPDGLLEISERVYVFDCCFTTDVLEQDEYRVYIAGIVAQLRDHSPDATFMVFNFREGEQQSQIASILSEYDTTVMDYPRHYEGCPLLTMEMVHHFLRSGESWLSLGHNNVLLMHCERGGWPVLAFMLAALLIYRKQYTGEQKTLDMIYKQAPRELLQLLSPLDPLPSQLRYLQYISRRNVGTEWPPLDRALTLDCVILRILPNFDREGGGCRPIFRIYGKDPSVAADRTPKVLFSTPKKSKAVRLYKADCELVKFDIHCHIQGDVVLECISLDEDAQREEMMFRVMFNTAFIRSNILILNRDEIDILWDAKDRFPKDFRAEILLSEMDMASPVINVEVASCEEKDGLPVEAFAKVKEIFSNVDWSDVKGDAALHVLQHIASSNALHDKLDVFSPRNVEGDALSHKSSPGVLKEILQAQEAGDGIKKVDAALHVLQHIASSNALQVKLDACSPNEGEGDSTTQKSSPGVHKVILQSEEANDGIKNTGRLDVTGDAVDAALHVLQQVVSSSALLEKRDAFSPKKEESDAIPQKQSPSVIKEVLQSKDASDGNKNMDRVDKKGDAAIHVPQHLTSSSALQEKRDAVYPEKVEIDAMPEKSSPGLLKETLQSQEANDGIERSSPPAPEQQHIPFHEHAPELKTNSQNIQLRDQHAAVHASQPKLPTRHMPSSQSTPASSSISLQDPPIPISEYHSPSSALGTIALPHDQATFGSSEVADSVATPPLAPSLSNAAVPALSESIRPETASPPPPLSALPSATSSATKIPITPLPSIRTSTTTTAAATATITPSEPSPLLPSPFPSSASPRTELPVPSPPPPLCPPSNSTITSALTTSPVTLPASPSSLRTPPPPPTVILPSSSPKATPLPHSPRYGTSSVGLSNYVPPSRSSSAGTSLPSGPAKCEPIIPILPALTFPTGNQSSMRPAPPPPPPPPPPPIVGLSSPFHPSSPVKKVVSAAPPPPPPHKVVGPSSSYHPTSPVKKVVAAAPPPPPPPPPPLVTPSSPHHPSSPVNKVVAAGPPPPPPPPPPLVAPSSPYPPPSPMKKAVPGPGPPPPPPPPLVAPLSPYPPPSPMKKAVPGPGPPPPPPPPSRPGATSSAITPSAPPPPLPPNFSSHKPSNAPPPPPPAFFGHGSLSGPNAASSLSGVKGTNREVIPPPPANGILGSSLGIKGRSSTRTGPRSTATKRTNLKPLHWIKVTRAMQGSLWAEAQKSDEASKAPEFDMSELESLFSAAMPNSDARGSTNKSSGRSSLGQKSDRVQLIDLRRANNCEIMLTKVKMPLPDLMSSLLALDDSVLDADQIDNLIKFCPTKEEMDLLKGFNGDKESLGKCEQYFLELMKVPRVESKLRVFSFKIQFRSQVADLSNNLNVVNSAAAEIRNSVKLKRIMQTILSLGNALNQGTARGSAIGFRLDSLLKLTDTRARNNKMTLMHYLCKVLAEKLPELLDFPKDLVSLEVASKIQLKTLAEEMQAISKGLEKVEQELTASENDGPISETFHKTLREFLVGAEAEVRALTSLYSNVGRSADALALYFGEDPARCPFEQVISTLLNFVKMFVRAHEENCKQLELEKKKAQKEAENEKTKLGTPKKESESLFRSLSKKNAFK